MNEELIFRPADGADMTRIMEIIRQAQAQMGALGSDQWQDGYPASENIGRDIEHHYGYVLCRHGGSASDEASPQDVIAYGAVVFDGEAAYDGIVEGQWLTDNPYVVLHRLAVADGEKGRGVAKEFFGRIETLAARRGVGSFRVDTNFDNRYMLRILEKLGFVYCGKVYYQSGERLAFEKVL